MAAIRDAAYQKHPDLDSYTKHDPLPARVPLNLKPTNGHDELTLSPEFMFHGDDRYHVNDLLKYHDRHFVRNAYRAILKREPDQAGLLHKLGLLQSGAFNKIDILASLRYSDEGERNGVTITGLKFPATIRKLERVPVIGYLLQLALGFVRLPTMIRSQRQFQGYIVAQQLAIADFVNERQRIKANELQLRSAVGNQLKALEAVVNEAVLPRILTEQEKFEQAESKLMNLDLRLSNLTQTVSRTRQQVSNLMSDLKNGQRTLSNESKPTDAEWDKFYAAFENEFRGSAEEVEERLRFYLPYLDGLNSDSTIVDLGSGRGDWLKLLGKEGFKPFGVEVNAVFAEQTRKQGLDVTQSEMMDYLGRQADDSVDVITAFHLIEHLRTDELIHLLDEVKRTLKPGGQLFIETPSPENLVVAACNFYADPTHQKPISPHTFMFLLGQKGFIDLKLQFLHPVDGSPFMGEREGSEQLNMWFFGPRDFSVIARKAH